jgi:myo-inositol-1(or 4)-monophosphatase
MPEDPGLLEFALATARAAGVVLLEHFETELAVATKSSDIDLVTPADRASELAITRRITAAYPGHWILAEESGRITGDAGPDPRPPPGVLQWVIDPLDGTTNFAHRFPHFSVSIALVDHDGPRLGVVHDPTRDETFFALRGHGAFIDSPRTRARHGQPAPLHVTSTRALRLALVATGFAYTRATSPTNNLLEFNRVVPQVRCIRRAGSAALDLAYLAAGRLDAYWEYHLQPWDIAAGALLVREAGGTLTRIDGGTWDLRHGDLVAAGPALAPILQAELASARNAQLSHRTCPEGHAARH